MGLDLGQAQDYTTWAVLEERQSDIEKIKEGLGLVNLNQLPLKTSWTLIADELKGLLKKIKGLNPEVIHLWVDATGLGSPVIDGFIKPVVEELSVNLHSVNITGGNKGWDAVANTVSKVHLIDNAMVMREQKTFKIAEDLKDKEIMKLFEEQIEDFRRTPAKRAGAIQYGSVAGEHDDLILAFALACLGYKEKGNVPRISVLDLPSDFLFGKSRWGEL